MADSTNNHPGFIRGKLVRLTVLSGLNIHHLQGLYVLFQVQARFEPQLIKNSPIQGV